MPPNRRERIQIPLKDRIKNGRTFQTSRRTDSGIVYLKCRTKCCAGTAKKMPDGNVILLRKHSMICYPDRYAQLKADFIDALKSALQRNFWRLKEVYETVAVMFPRELRVQVPYNTIKSSLKRWRRQFYPPCPETLQLMAFQITQPENNRLLEYDVGRLTAKIINDNDGDLHILIYDAQFVETEFSNVSRLFIDGTFKTTPRVTGVYQLVSILGVKYDHAIPFAHILMSKKTECAYTAVLAEIKNSLINGDSVLVIMSDYEQALRNASRAVFTNAHIAGCNIHYDRALLKKIKSLRLSPLIRANEEAKLFLKKLLALAFLPSEMIEAEYEALKNGLSLPLKRSFATFLAYYARQWLRIVKPAGFSVFGLSRRTNNVTESYNSVLADKLGEHPSAWTFMGKLVKMTSNARDDVQSLAMSKKIKRHPRYATVFKQKMLTSAWKQLHLRQLTPAEFLNKVALLKGHISNRLTSIPDQAEEDDVELDRTQDNYRIGDPDYNIDFLEDPVLNNFMIDNAHGVPVQAPDHELDFDHSESSSSVDGSETETERENENQMNAGANDESVEEQDPTQSSDDENAENIPDEIEDAGQSPVAMSESDAFGNEHSEPEAVILDNHDRENELDNAHTVPTANEECSQQRGNENLKKAICSRKKNLRKKRARQRKVQNLENQVRPYGHKRRKRNKNKQGPKCVVCLGEIVSHGFFPCGHNCCCQSCASILAAKPIKKCPKCRQIFQECIRIFNEN